MKESLKNVLREKLTFVYEDERKVEEILSMVEEVTNKYEGIQSKGGWLTEKDAMLITYGDTLVNGDEKGLVTLKNFLNKYVGDALSAVHLLPMYPWTEDDGFSVVDYKAINPDLGEWQDVINLSDDYGLMFDAVINHISKSSEWFQKYLKGEKPYDGYFIECDPDADYSKVFRPRTTPLLTKFDTVAGEKYIWTSFCDDQIDLNYKSIHLYVDILDVLLTYAKNGARFIRLDAIGLLWKELGTRCFHHPKTHEIIKTYRAVLEEYAPGTMFITETNVPHEDNVSYFGNGNDEAHLVYQFPLPPLVMYSFLTENTSKLSKWADDMGEPMKGTTYFNFLSSHDGIGVGPTHGILDDDERQIILDAALRNGGLISYKDNGDGTKSAYELNINYQDALTSPEEDDQTRIKRFLAAETILISLQGLPGIYIHSLLGSRNDYYGRTTSGIPRRINREKLDVNELSKMLDIESNRKVIFDELIRRLNIRKQYKQFAPDSHQKILFVDERVFAFERFTDVGEKITVLINVSSQEVSTDLNIKGTDLLAEEKIDSQVVLQPLQSMWILEEN